LTSDLLKEFAIKLIQEAECDIESAINQLQNSRYHKSIFEAQQSSEKMMKACLALEGLTQVYDHDPRSLFASEVMIRADDKFLDSLRAIIRETDWLMAQYPYVRYARLRSHQVLSPLDRYEKKHAEKAIKIAEDAFKTIKEFVMEQYNLKIK